MQNELQQLLKVVTDLQKWEYVVLICKTLRLEEASWLDPGIHQHCYEELNPLLHTEDPDTIP